MVQTVEEHEERFRGWGNKTEVHSWVAVLCRVAILSYLVFFDVLAVTALSRTANKSWWHLKY